MLRADQEIYIAVVASTVLMVLLAGVVGIAILRYRQRVKDHLQEMMKINVEFERELLQTQIETQNHTLQQIAEELHDNIGQLLTVAIMRLNALEDDIAQPNAQQSMEQTRQLIHTIVTEVRALSKTLDFDTVERFGLLPSLTLELERIQRTGRVQTRLITTGEAYLLGTQAEIVLLRMAQESLNNALKHARAHTLTVSTDYQPSAFLLTIADDGKGFDVNGATARPLSQAGSGLVNLYRRAELMGGTCTIISKVGAGTRVEIQLPHSPTAKL